MSLFGATLVCFAVGWGRDIGKETTFDVCNKKIKSRVGLSNESDFVKFSSFAFIKKTCRTKGQKSLKKLLACTWVRGRSVLATELTWRSSLCNDKHNYNYYAEETCNFTNTFVGENWKNKKHHW